MKLEDKTIEPNMYVRTKCGIEQIYRIDNNKTKYKYLYKLKKQDGDGCIDCGCLCIEDIIGEPSFNPIDLIEVGDFITLGENNYPLQIRNIWENGGDIHIELSNGAKFEDLHYNNEFKIYSIVTKEQMEAMAYKVV